MEFADNKVDCNSEVYLFATCQISRLVQIESICRRQNKRDSDFKFDLVKFENLVGKGENAGYQYFFLFPPCF